MPVLSNAWRFQPRPVSQKRWTLIRSWSFRFISQASRSDRSRIVLNSCNAFKFLQCVQVLSFLYYPPQVIILIFYCLFLPAYIYLLETNYPVSLFPRDEKCSLVGEFSHQICLLSYHSFFVSKSRCIYKYFTIAQSLSSRTFCPKIAIFSQFQLSQSIITHAEQITNLLLLHHFYSVISYRQVQKESDELLCTVLVTRYGPQSVASASG